jgi:hypothetical protein
LMISASSSLASRCAAPPSVMWVSLSIIYPFVRKAIPVIILENCAIA